jgi:rubrerythrin
MSSTFQKKVEDFVCEVCGKSTKGDGYTDHCSYCLWGKHVDNNPGDRKSECHGLMEPVSVEVKGGKNTIHYVCKKCGKSHRVRASQDDNPDIIIELSTR